MFIRGGKHKERLLLYGGLNFVRACTFQIVDLTLTKNESFCFYSPFFEGNTSGHVFNVLNDEIDRNSVVSETRDNDVSVHDRRQDKVPEGILDKFVVLIQDTDDTTTSFSIVSLQSAAETDIV